MLSLFLSLLAITCFGLETYEDYSVVRFHEMSDKSIAFLEEEDLDVWQTNKLEGWADVMIHRDQLEKYLNLYPAYKVVYENVQEEVNRSLEENEKARLASVGKPFAFDHFPTPAEVRAYMTQTANNYPNLVTTINIGNSYGGNPIGGLRLNSGSPNAPRFVIQCTIHAREWITTTTCAYIIDQLLTVDTNLLQYYNWIIIPVLNVDGYAYSHSSTRLWRKNRQPGSSCVGTDLNRNYGQGWGGGGSSPDSCSDTYRGTSAFSAPEVARERDYIQNLNIAAFVDIHSYGGLFMSPWGYTSAYPPTADYNEMDRLMTASCNSIRGVNGASYAYGSSYHTIYQASGGSNDWTYGYLGVVPSFCIECRGTTFTAPISQITPIGREVYAGIRTLALQVYANQQQ